MSATFQPYEKRPIRFLELMAVGNWLIKDVHDITSKRIANAAYYDAALREISQVRVPPRPSDCKRVFHLYIVFAERRDQLFQYCLDKGIEAKVHYPIPIYRQPALDFIGHKAGDFPVTDRHTTEIITFPCDQHLSREEMDYVIETVRSFYAAR